MIREIVSIDEEKCDGCGECVPSCKEGAIQIINGKARLVADNLCDGLGACLGHCPQGAIRIEKREAPDFDEHAVARHLGLAATHRGAASPASARSPITAQVGAPVPSGCPSARFARMDARPAGPAATPCAVASPAETPSELTHWPVQLRLLPAAAPVLRGAHLLIAADCVPVAYADFHRKMLRGRAVVVACPKLDDPDGYVEKLAQMMQEGGISAVTVAHMEVPCCTGILRMAMEARRLSGAQLAIHDVVVSTRGEILTERVIAAA